MQSDYATKAEIYLQTLCGVKPNRRTGSAGNQAATVFFAETIQCFGYKIDATPFDCLDYVCGESSLCSSEDSFAIYVSPYSLRCDVKAELVVVSTVAELQVADCQDKLLLLRGEICVEQLMPKNFVFYNPTHHQQIIALLESHQPAAIIAATTRSPDTTGALYPFPLLMDGDFNIPSVYCTDIVGEQLAERQGEELHLTINAARIASTASNVVAHLHSEASEKIVITAHIDAFEEVPGALDNASGTAVLLLLAEMLAGYQGAKCIELIAFNGEDHYSAGGQMNYLARYGAAFDRIRLAINVDGVGYKKGQTAYSFYGCAPQLEQMVEDVFSTFRGLVRGEPWFSGDHMLFVQQGIPSGALTSENAAELMRTIVHTAADTPDMVDTHRLVEVAEALNSLVRANA